MDRSPLRRSVSDERDNRGAVNRRIVTVEHSVVRIDQRIRIPRIEIGTDVSGPACIYAHVEIRKGTVMYLHGEAEIGAPRGFAVFLPPFAVVQARLERCELTSAGIAFRPPTPYTLPRRPLLLAATAEYSLTSVDEILGELQTAEGALDVGRAPDPCPLASRTKAILDAEYGTAVAIDGIARQVHAAPATLSRTFKRAYGMPPVRYRHQVRIMDALMRFAEGATPAEVFADVGFGDLSRFYKIFRKVACAAPGSYRPVRSRNAKT
jgi:AraC-like DNA-binding protein